MNRIIAPVALVIALALSSAAMAAPQTNPDFATKFFTEQATNGN